MEEDKNNNNHHFETVNANEESAFQSFQPNGNRPRSQKTGSGFGKTVLVPFLCGALGAGVVIGSCASITSIRNQLFGSATILESNGNSVNLDTVLDSINTKMVSLGAYSDTAIEVAKKIQPSIVGIEVEYSVNSIFSRNPQTSTASGSGVIISEDGYILTNNHVINSSASDSMFYEIEEANKVTVTLYNDDTEYEAKIIGTDEQTDLAVIKIDKKGLTAAELGDSDSVQVGEFCMAIGNPLGLKSTVTAGIVSAVNRDVTDSDGNTYAAIQTDAAINSGNSGGALVNSKGQVIGINTLKVSGTGVEGVGFAIPINSTKNISEQLIQYNKVKRPYLGLGITEVNEDLAKRYNLVIGLYVRSVEAFSSAEKAGLKIGDVITAVDGTKVTTMDELNEIKNKKAIGDKITLTINRDGKESNVTVTLQEQP